MIVQRQGRITIGGGFGDLDPDELAPSRDDLAAETARLLDAIRALGQDWFNSADNTVSQSLLSQWDAYIAEVKRWDAGPDLVAHIFNRTWLNELVAYQRKFNEFLAAFGSAGVQPSMAPFAFSAHAPGIVDEIVGGAKKAADDALGTIKTVAIVGGLTLVGLYVFTVYEAGRTVRHGGIKLL